MTDHKQKARLDLDKTAKPLTQITKHFGYKQVDTGYIVQTQGYLDHYEIHNLDPAEHHHKGYICECGYTSKLSWWGRLKLDVWYYLGWD